MERPLRGARITLASHQHLRQLRRYHAAERSASSAVVPLAQKDCVRMIVISREEVAKHLSYEVCIPLVREAMIALARGETRQLLRSILDLADGHMFGLPRKRRNPRGRIARTEARERSIYQRPMLHWARANVRILDRQVNIPSANP